MNRHFQAYNALPCEPLGAPIRREAEKPSPETPWKPIPGHPHHVERINAQGAREVSHKDHVPAPSPQAAPAAPALDPGRVVPEDVHGSCLKPADVPAKW